MESGEIKTLLTALVMPPAGPLLLGLVGLMLARRILRQILLALSLGSLWFLSTNVAAIALSSALLPQFPAIKASDLATDQVQAIVVLGGGVQARSPEYGQAQPSAHTLARLRYGVTLSRQTGRPLAFSGGVGWAAAGTATPGEAEVAQQFLRQDYATTIRWSEGASRDTRENALNLRPLMQRDGISRIALVTDAWHMPRAVMEFERAGFEVTPAPTGFIATRERPLLEWLPSGHGLAASRNVLREWLAIRMAGDERGRPSAP
jgi:uncharacterized SAM-binding protein YcdF (DUF218 family)